jgi:outer membrane protein OmpA-like peptidoglycan-associated protein
MKYVKLFEHWLLEAEGKQDSFDVNNPGGWPVMNTTIGDFRNSVAGGKDESFLLSVLRRSLQTGEEWNPKSGEDKIIGASYGKSPAKTGFKPNIRVREAMKALNLDFEDGSKMENFYDSLSKHITEQKFCNYDENFTAKNFTKIVKDFSNYARDLEKMTPEKRIKFTGINNKNTVLVVKQILKGLEQKLASVESSPSKPFISIRGENFELELEVADIKDSSLNSDDANIVDFICKDINTLEIDGEYYTPSIKENELTLGMVMTWLNNFAKTGSNKEALLSNTGFKNYKKDIASIFAGEEAENLTSFAATIKIGGQNINFANSKGDGTETPMFGNGQMLGKCTFAFNSFEITEAGKSSIADSKLMSALMKAQKNIEIIGHTDSSGKEAYNQTLSEKRANAVLEELKKNKDFTKIKATLTAVGKGETQPAKDDEGGKNKTNAALNRRVEFIIDGKPAFDYSKI